MKKRSCRMTEEERSLHEQAVRLRKMTDEQLIEHINYLREEAYTAGYAEAERQRPTSPATGKTLEHFIEELSAGACKGVKSATAYKIEEFARAQGYIE